MSGKYRETCILCGVQEFRRLFRAGSYAIVRCSNCGMVQTFPMDSHVDPDEFYNPECFRTLERRMAHERMYQGRILDLIMRHKASGCMLEVGSGPGIFIELASSRGWKIEGIEPAAAAIRQISENVGIRVHQGTLESVDLSGKHFDVIVLRHVLEHMEAPKAALMKLGEWLRPNGLLCIAVPNFNGLHALVEKERWFHLSIPFHVAHYTPRTLRTLLDHCRFEILELKTFDLSCSSYFLLIANLFMKFGSKGPADIHVSPLETDPTRSLWHRLISKERYLNRWLAMLGLGDELAVIGRKTFNP